PEPPARAARDARISWSSSTSRPTTTADRRTPTPARTSRVCSVTTRGSTDVGQPPTHHDLARTGTSKERWYVVRKRDGHRDALDHRHRGAGRARRRVVTGPDR